MRRGRLRLGRKPKRMTASSNNDSSVRQSGGRPFVMPTRAGPLREYPLPTARWLGRSVPVGVRLRTANCPLSADSFGLGSPSEPIHWRRRSRPDGMPPALSLPVPHGGDMAEIRVAPTRRNRAVVWIVIVAIIVAAAAWYFLAGPGA